MTNNTDQPRSFVRAGSKRRKKSLRPVLIHSIYNPRSPLYTAPATTLEVFKDRDTRMCDTFMKRGDPMKTTKPIFDVVYIVFNKTGFMFRKFANIDDWNTQISLIHLRYEEALLINTEAKYKHDYQRLRYGLNH